MFFRGLFGGSTQAGGSAGGSIWITTKIVEGDGVLSVSGGNGGDNAGGGSGGMIALYYSEGLLLWDVQVAGGAGYISGASGMAYLHKTNLNKKLLLDNNLQRSAGFTTLVCKPNEDYIFDEIKLMRAAKLTMTLCPSNQEMTLQVTKTFSGDGSGILRVDSLQNVYLSTNVNDNQVKLQNNIEINPNGLVLLPDIVLLSKGVSLLVNGSLIGVKNITVSKRSKFYATYPGSTKYRSQPGVFDFDFLRVEQGGFFEASNWPGLKLTVKLLQLDYGAQYNVSSRVVTNYVNKIEQKRGSSLGNSCPYGFVHHTSENVDYNPCGEGRRSSVYAPIPYQVEVNLSDASGVYRLENQTRYRQSYNITCDYTDFRLLPGQSCVFEVGSHSYRRLEILSEATMSFKADANRRIKNSLRVEQLKIYSGGYLRALSGKWSGVLSHGIGGSYGGTGGGGSLNDIYGDVLLPEKFGSNGGGSSSSGEGGGQITLHVSRMFQHNGVIDVSGGSDTTGGGGSGGSLLLFANDLKGDGEFVANGGNGSIASSGGGGGGRIAIHINSSKDDFEGKFTAYGGTGKYNGSPGTIFIKDKNSINGSLIINGEGSQVSMLPVNASLNTFDALSVGESAKFRVSQRQLTVGLLNTDGSGEIMIPLNHHLEIMKLPSNGILSCQLNVIGSLKIHVSTSILRTINLYGKMEVPRLTVGKVVNLKLIKGVIKTEKLILRQYSIALLSGLSTLNIAEINVGPHAKIEVNTQEFKFLCTKLVFEAYSELISTSELKSFNITSDSLEIHNFASIGVTGGGFKEGRGYSNISGIGGSYGGEAANARRNSAYGSVFEPSEYGSGGIGSDGSKFNGGGRLIINVAGYFVLNGEVHADGLGSQMDGGGSGGSILIKAKIFNGSGIIRANGMSGGSGGRIAMYVEDRQGYLGIFSAFGGCSSACGAAGTVFIREFRVGLPYETTIINNAGRRSTGITAIMHGLLTKYTLETLKIIREGRVEIISDRSNQTAVLISILNLIGDATGQLRVLNNQVLSLGSGTSTRPFVLRSAVSVEKGAEMILAPRVFVKETTLKPSFDVKGKVQGGQEIIVGRNAQVRISPEGIIGTKSSQKGTLTLRTLQILTGGHILINHGGKTNVELRAFSISIEYNGILESPFVTLKTPELLIRLGGLITSNALGYKHGPGTGRISGREGGSYGSCGGSLGDKSCPIYGSLFSSKEPGSGGGSEIGSKGGIGGGVIVLSVGSLSLDGMITSNGGNGEGRAGGGSGGSIYMRIDNVFIGNGKVSCRGGASGIDGGGGSGGRIYLESLGTNSFLGKYDASGGEGRNLNSGSPGTIWLLERSNARTMKTLIIDNKNVSSTKQLPVFFNETISAYEFDILRLNGNIKVTPDHHMVIQKLISTSQTTINIPDNLVVEIDTSSAAASPLCSFHVAKHGELRLPSSVTFLGPDNQFSGTITGVLDMVIGEGRRTTLSNSARTALFVDGNYTFISRRGEYKFASLLLKSNALLTFENSNLTEVPLSFATLELRYGSRIKGSWLNIQAVSIVVHLGAKIDLSEMGHKGGSGEGRGAFKNNYGHGAGHAGIGGGKDSSGGTWYGEMVTPNEFGSGGGGNVSSHGGKGGGYIKIKTSQDFVVDGSISVDGGSCLLTACGGGSGGSIYIESRTFRGVGRITANGGNGFGNGGGGSGGRVALHLNDKMIFQGRFQVEGGKGQYIGSSGTVYIEEDKNRIPKKIVIVDNHIRTSNLKPKTFLTNTNMAIVSLDELRVQGPASVWFVNKNKSSTLGMEISVTELKADRKAEIVIQANQIMFSAASESEETSFTLRTNLVVEEMGLFVTASKLSIDGVGLTVKGRLMNVRDLTLETGGSVTFSENSETGVYLKGFGSVFVSKRGNQLFGSLTLKSGSKFSAPQSLRIQVASMIVKNGVLLRVNDLQISAGTITLEQGAMISADDVSAGGQGSGLLDSNIGSGGSYASPGGKNEEDRSYGSLFKPEHPGSVGGNGYLPGSGGKGGGVIVIKATSFNLDGKLTANGGSGDEGTSAGGGSGGSIYIEVDNLLGKGEIITNGGIGDGRGGCGSGGRIGIVLKSRFRYRGKMSSASLNCANRQNNGGPGTIFVNEVRNRRIYKKIIVDNRFANPDIFVSLNESHLEYNFEELELRGGASLQLKKHPYEQQILKVGLLSGDRTGLVYIHRNQTLVVSDKTPARIPVSFKVDEGGFVIVPENLIVVGLRKYSIESFGTILGIRNMELARDRVVRFYDTSILDIKRDISDFTQSKGVLEFGSLILHSSSSLIIDDLTRIKIQAESVNIKYNASIISFSLEFSVSTLHVEIGSRIDCSGDNVITKNKTMATELETGGGAGHGSDGGNGTLGGGSYHGSLYIPTELGKAGGSNVLGEKGGHGGGSLLITVGSRFIVDGTITVSGGSARSGSNAGGGSAGSVLVRTFSYRGYGVMNARGGASGGSFSGSGSGGRIAVYIEKDNLYRGIYHASGGKATQGRHGGPGTIFQQYPKNKRLYVQLMFGERTGSNLVFVTLDEKNVTEYVFDEVILEKTTALKLKEDGATRILKIVKLTGDGTGYIYIGRNHTFNIQGSTGHGDISRPAVNLNIDFQGTALFDKSLYVVGDSPSSPNQNALRLNGQIIGVQHLYLTRERKMLFMSTAQTIKYEDDRLVADPLGTFVFATFEAHDGARLTFNTKHGMKGIAGKMEIKYGAKILADQFILSK